MKKTIIATMALFLGCGGPETLTFSSGTTMSGSGGSASTTPSSSTTTSSSSSTGGTGGSGTGGSGTGSGGVGGETTTSSSTTTSTTTITCTGALQHVCDGMCVENTAQSGCATSVDCLPCPVPANASIAICDQAGKCDFSCQSGYEKDFNICKCKKDCCKDSDCPSGKTCNTGVCVGPGCDPAECQTLCQAQCLSMGKQFGFGICTMDFPTPQCACSCF